MNDPTRLDLGNWALELLTAAAVAILGWALAMVNRGKQQMEAKVENLERETANHKTQLAVLKTCQVNTAERLTEIKTATHDTNDKLDQLAATVTDVLMAIKRQG